MILHQLNLKHFHAGVVVRSRIGRELYHASLKFPEVSIELDSPIQVRNSRKARDETDQGNHEMILVGFRDSLSFALMLSIRSSCEISHSRCPGRILSKGCDPLEVFACKQEDISS